jgi:hypothetical protein
MRTAELLDEQLFCDLYGTLKEITAEYDEPSPAELWDEAAVRWKPLLAAKRPELAVELLQEELTEKYNETSAFLVLMILMYMLVAMFRPTKESPYHAYCAALAGATHGHPLLKRLWEGVRMTEDKEEQAGHRIGVVTSLLTEMKASDEAIDLDTIEQCVLRFPTIDLQQRALEQADNLLRGTAWSQRSGIVEKKMYAQQKEQLDRQHKMDEAVKKSLEEPRTQNIYGDKNEFQSGAQLLKMGIPQGTDPAKIAARIAEQQALLEQKENKKTKKYV